MQFELAASWWMEKVHSAHTVRRVQLELRTVTKFGAVA